MVTSVTSSSAAQAAQQQQLLQQAAAGQQKQSAETIGAAADRDSGAADAIADQKRITASQAEQQAQLASKQNVKQPEPPPPEQPKPVINTSGQVTGTTINTTA
ncbi:hypothetical protein ACO0LC_03700 [Undibacterium sp. JH2W]|uniref:hypothetical protein n=1 Tax=Undibacterium sp. JH2W TaxID=3413037 RepID=UPI003BF3F36F